MTKVIINNILAMAKRGEPLSDRQKRVHDAYMKVASPEDWGGRAAGSMELAVKKHT